MPDESGHTTCSDVLILISRLPERDVADKPAGLQEIYKAIDNMTMGEFWKLKDILNTDSK
jgi:hypothetical protein